MSNNKSYMCINLALYKDDDEKKIFPGFWVIFCIFVIAEQHNNNVL